MAGKFFYHFLFILSAPQESLSANHMTLVISLDFTFFLSGTGVSH